MRLLGIKKNQIINLIENYHRSLGNKELSSVNHYISKMKGMILKQTENDARYIECEEKMIQSLLTEQINLYSYHWNLCLIVFLGQNVQYNCKSILENVLKESTKFFLLPTKLNDNRIRICMSFFKVGETIESDVDDSATQLLQYFD